MTSRIRQGSLIAAACLGVGLAMAPPPAAARVDVDLNVFIDALEPHGVWFDYPGYGHAWRPSHVGRDWRPYTDGRWVWSDDYGWVWDEDEDWGWATYHYGRWLVAPGIGWIWIPGYEWAPAWVRWRRGPSYIGWYPVPPVGFSVSIVLSNWIFVSQHDFFRPRLHDVVFVPDHRIFRECREEIRMHHRRGHWFNRGADRHGIERIARATAPVVRVRDVDRPDGARFVRGERGDHDELRVFRPNVRETKVARRFPGADGVHEESRPERARKQQPELDARAPQGRSNASERRAPPEQRIREPQRQRSKEREPHGAAAQPRPELQGREVDRRERQRASVAPAPRQREERAHARESVERSAHVAPSRSPQRIERPNPKQVHRVRERQEAKRAPAQARDSQPPAAEARGGHDRR